jgi:histone H3/H4
MSTASPQSGAFADSDDENASMDTSDLKSGDIDSLEDDEDDTENDEDDDDDAIPVASVVASGSLSEDDDAADDEKEGGESADKIFATDGTTPLSSPSSSGKRKAASSTDTPSAKKQRQPAAKGLFVPFRTVKKIMQQDPDINIIQNDAAVMVTAATGMFLKEFTEKSLESCKRKGRNTIKYDDVAEVRAKNKNYAFLDLLLP